MLFVFCFFVVVLVGGFFGANDDAETLRLCYRKRSCQGDNKISINFSFKSSNQFNSKHTSDEAHGGDEYKYYPAAEEEPLLNPWPAGKHPDIGG